MKKYLILLVLLGTGLTGLLAQNGTLDLLVTDTLILKPREITLQFRAAIPELEQQLNDNVDYSARNQMVESMLRENQRQLLAFLSQQKIAFQEASKGINLEGRPDPTPFYEVRFKSVGTLQAFMKLLEGEKIAEGNVGELIYDYGAPEEQLLLERLIKKAKQKAAKLAELAQVKLGGIVAIVEEPSPAVYPGIPSAYLYEEGGRYDYNTAGPSAGNNRGLTRVFTKSIRVKFAINP